MVQVSFSQLLLSSRHGPWICHGVVVWLSERQLWSVTSFSLLLIVSHSCPVRQQNWGAFRFPEHKWTLAVNTFALKNDTFVLMFVSDCKNGKRKRNYSSSSCGLLCWRPVTEAVRAYCDYTFKSHLGAHLSQSTIYYIIAVHRALPPLTSPLLNTVSQKLQRRSPLTNVCLP